MVFPVENSPPSSSKTHLLKPCLTSINESEAPQNRSAPSPPNLKFLPFSVSFNGWRFANTNFKSWARKMAALHEPIWRKAGIFEAVIASTYKIHQNTDLVLGIAEQWCPHTNTFVFPWGETSITLEDVMVQRNEEPDEIGSKAGKNMIESPFDENNSSEPPFDDIVVSPPETRQTCDDELDVYGSNAEKRTMVDDGSKKPDCLLHEDGIIAGEKASSDEKLCSSEAEKEDDVFVDDDSSIQKKLSLEELALKADNNEPSPHQKVASGDTNGDETSRTYKSKVLSPSDESNIHIAVGEVSQRHDCLLHDNALGSDETKKSNAGNVSYEKRFQELVVLASSIDERITKAQKTVAWLKERRATKKRFCSSSFDLGVSHVVWGSQMQVENQRSISPL